MWRGSAFCERFNPNTPAKALALMMEAMTPKQQNDLNRILQAIDLWDLKAQSLEKEFGEKLSDRMKTAFVLSMIPGDLQDMIYQQAANMKDYPDVKARLKRIVQNRISRDHPSPMDIGKVSQDKYEGEYEHDQEIYYTGTWERQVKMN